MSLIGKRIIFGSGDICKVCNNTVWYFANEPYKIGKNYYIACPTCGNEIQITE